MTTYKIVAKKKVLCIWLLTGLILCTLLIFPTQCRNGATNGIFLCIQVLIPSLLPFMILSSFLVSSNILCYTPKFLGVINRVLFGLPEVSLGVIFLSVIGGYPVGAFGIRTLYEDGHITQKQAQRMALFCVSSGPGFLVTYLGATMMRDIKTGYILFISQIISVIILGIFSRFAVKTDDLHLPKPKPRLKVKEALIKAVNSSINNSLKISVLVILFATASEVFLTLTVENTDLKPLVGLIEITNGIKVTAGNFSAPLISFLCGFAGLCVHLQIFSQLEIIRFSKGKFYLFRAAQGILCALITWIILSFFPVAEETISTVSYAKPEINSGITGIIFLFITCLGFMISVRSLNFRKKSNKP